MKRTHVCAVCDNPSASVRVYSERVKVGRRFVEVEGLAKVECSECGTETVPEEMHDANLALIRAAIEGSRAAVSRGFLRTFREAWSLSQREASRLFGAGATSFAKWESGQAQMSTPTALLLKCAYRFPDVVQYLGKLSQVSVPDAPAVERTYRGGAYETVRISVGNCANVSRFPTSPHARAARHLPRGAQPGKPDWGRGTAVRGAGNFDIDKVAA